MATASAVASEQTEIIVDGLERAVINGRPVNKVSPMVVQFPEKKSLDKRDGPIQESMPPKSNFPQIKDLYLKDVMPDGSTLAYKIAQMLNRDNNRIIRNWRHLAESLGVSEDVCLSFMCDQEHSPTEDLFDYLNTWRPEMTIEELKRSLRSMGRNDMVQFLVSKGMSNDDKISNHQEIVETFKEKLDIQSRTLSWTQLAIKCKIQKKIYSKFGKPKLGPTSQLFLHIRLSDKLSKLSIRELREHIKNMDRYDVVKVFEQHKINDDALVKDVFKVDTQILDETSELLDKDLRSTKNWRNLAVRLDIPNHTYEDFDTSKGSNNKNPTMLLLKWLAVSQSQLKVDDFINHLKKIQRNDVVEELEKEKPAAFQRKLKEIQESQDTHAVVTHQGSFFQGGTVVSDGLCSNNSANVTSTLSKDLPVMHLPREIFGKICARLDAEDPFFRDYRMLAEQLGVSSDQIRILEQRKSNPTQSLLIDYKLRIKQFWDILKKIEREDVMEIIEPWLYQESPNDSEETVSPHVEELKKN